MATLPAEKTSRTLGEFLGAFLSTKCRVEPKHKCHFAPRRVVLEEHGLLSMQTT